MRAGLAVALLAVPALASSGPADEVLLDEVSFGEDAYVAWRVSGPAGATARVDLFLDPGEAGMAGLGTWTVSPQGKVWGGMGMGFGLTEVRVAAQAGDPRAAVDVAGPAWVGFTSGMGLRVPLAGDGDWHIVLAGAADGDLSWEARLFGTEGTTVAGRSLGPAFLFREIDFQGTLGIVAKGIGAQAKLLADTRLELPVEHRLFARFTGDNYCGDLRVGHAGPAGSQTSEVPRGDWFDHRFPGTPEGGYTMRIDFNRDQWPCTEPDAGDWPPEVWFAGADVALP